MGEPNPEVRQSRPEPTGERRSGNGLGYQPALDGMRGVGLVTVMGAHLAVAFPWIAPYTSWLGVDLFFVLSGFLITTLLLREYGRTDRIDLGAFYLRRVARLYPAIVAVLITSIVLRIFFSELYLTPKWLGIASIAGYFSNWVVLAQNSFRSLAAFSPVWSLAIEEQFYIAWPFIIYLMLKSGLHRKWMVAIIGSALVVMDLHRALLWTRWIRYAHAYPDKAAVERYGNILWIHIFNGTLTRPDGLLIGSLAAIIIGYSPKTPGSRTRLFLWIVGPAGLLIDAIIFSHTPIDGHPKFIFLWGLAVFNFATLLMIIHTIYTPKSPLTWFFSIPPLVWLGQRSYGIYLIHLFAYQIATHNGWESPLQISVVTLLIFVVAGLSYSYFEAPVRQWMRRRLIARAAARPHVRTTT